MCCVVPCEVKMNIILCLTFLLGVARSSRILGVFPVPGLSHHTAATILMRTLAENGHEVTMVSPLEMKNTPENFTGLFLSGEKVKIDNFFDFNAHRYLQLVFFNLYGAPLVDSVFSHEKFQELIDSKVEYDLVIVEEFYSDGLKYLGVYLNAPMIVYCTLDASSWTNPSFGNPAPPSYVPDISLPGSNGITFFERLDNAIMRVLNDLVRTFILLPGQDEVVKKYFPGAPDISEYNERPSMILLNADNSVNAPVPKVPGMIDIGGFHLKEPKALPSDLQKELDNAKHGFIYFSMGSNLQSVKIPKDILAAIMKTFSKLKETVIWKWEDDELPGKPDNVILRKWLPQNDVLAHKNIKLFITHGGMFSTMEAVFNSVPCLYFPIFGDQNLNAARAESYGFARTMTFTDITEEKLHSEIQELLTNPKYSENAKKRSAIMRDKPMSPREKLVYWVEYAIRHKGGDHLRVAALKLSWYQYLLIDIIAFILVCSILFILFVTYSIRYSIRLCKKFNSKKSQ